jgi:hypothetical protein
VVDDYGWEEMGRVVEDGAERPFSWGGVKLQKRCLVSKAPLSGQRRHDWCSSLTCSRTAALVWEPFSGLLQPFLTLLNFLAHAYNKLFFFYFFWCSPRSSTKSPADKPHAPDVDSLVRLLYCHRPVPRVN